MIIVPELALTDANIKDVLEFLQRTSIENDRSADGTKGLNIILAPALSARLKDTPRLTMSLHNTSLHEILTILSKILQVQYYLVGNSTVVFGQPDTEVVARTYDILPSTRRIVSADTEGETATVKAKTYFERAGVTFPDGAGVQFLPQVGKVVFRNTIDNLILMERLLAIVNVVPCQVETTFRLVEVLDSSSVVTNQVIDMDTEDILAARAKLRLVLDTTVTAQHLCQASNTVRHPVKTDKGTPSVPCTASFVVTPEVHPTGEIIHLGLNGRVSLGGENPVEYGFATRIELSNHGSMFFWLNTCGTNELTTRYLRVAARLVDLSGIPIAPVTNLPPLIPPVYQSPKP